MESGDVGGNSKWKGPTNYQIRVGGVLDERWSDRLGGMGIGRSTAPEESAETTLTGVLRDQAALVGVLNTLYEMHLTILSVEALGAKVDDRARKQD